MPFTVMAGILSPARIGLSYIIDELLPCTQKGKSVCLHCHLTRLKPLYTTSNENNCQQHKTSRIKAA